MLTVKEASKKLSVEAATVRNYIRNGVNTSIVLTQEWHEDVYEKTGWESSGWEEPDGFELNNVMEWDKFYNPIKAKFIGKEKLKAISVMHGRRREYRIKNDDLEEYRKKWLTYEKQI